MIKVFFNSMFEEIMEGKAKVTIPIEKKVSKKLPVFYNPVMKNNRDISIAVLKSIDNKNMQIALPLAGTGVRGVRFLLELPKNKIKNISFNDYDKNAVKIIKKNLSDNKILSKYFIFNDDADIFMLNSKGFDYIDIDPFGSPNPFLDSAIKRIARNGILAVTATDTAPLCGTYPKTCKRKYWSTPCRDHRMHEFGLRILIRKIQLVGAQYDRALVPIYSYFKDHYFRIFFRSEKGKSKVDKLLKEHSFVEETGPLWIGPLFEDSIAKNVHKIINESFTKTALEESKENIVGFYNIHRFCKKHKLVVPKTDLLFENLKKEGFKVFKTHFDPVGMKTNATEKELLKIVKKIKK